MRLTPVSRMVWSSGRMAQPSSRLALPALTNSSCPSRKTPGFQGRRGRHSGLPSRLLARRGRPPPGRPTPSPWPPGASATGSHHADLTPAPPALVQRTRAGHLDRLAPGAVALADHERMEASGTVHVDPASGALARRAARHRGGSDTPARAQGTRAGHLDRPAPRAVRLGDHERLLVTRAVEIGRPVSGVEARLMSADDGHQGQGCRLRDRPDRLRGGCRGVPS